MCLVGLRNGGHKVDGADDFWPCILNEEDEVRPEECKAATTLLMVGTET